MRKIRIALVATVVGLLGVALGGATADAATATLHLGSTTVVAGHTVSVSGVCEPNTSGFVISAAFLNDAAHDFAGVGAVPFATDSHGAFSGTAIVPRSRAAGTYTVTARCGGGNLGVELHLRVTAAGGAVTGVPAGTGGLVAATTTGTRNWQYGIGLGGLLLLAGATAGLVRRQRALRR